MFRLPETQGIICYTRSVGEGMLWRKDHILQVVCGGVCADGHMRAKNREGPRSRAQRDVMASALSV